MIEIKHLSKTFQMKDGAVNALKNIDLTIPDGSIYGIIGMSGAGKSRAADILEDLDFYCVDNLPVSLVEKFVELIAMPGSEISKVALGLDVRADQNFMDATRILEQLKEKGYNPVNQLVGYILSEDPTYITTYKGARSLIRKVDRDDLLQAMLRSYLNV